ncbi:MAG: hypothetical protein AAGU11_00865 [Syntrophobacteraceae bacterium]
MIKEAMQYLFTEVVDKVKRPDPVIQVGAHSYRTIDKFELVKEPDEPVAKSIEITTLSGLIDYLERNADSLDLPKLTVQVCSHEMVKVIGPVFGNNKQRANHLYARLPSFEGFAYGQYYDNEAFIIALQTMFVQDETRDKILRIVSNLLDTSSGAFKDNGLSQEVVVKTGVVAVEQIELPNPVRLQPWRTFREIDQPHSQFVLRLKQNEGGPPKCALFEADGGIWIFDAIAGIKEYLVKFCPKEVGAIIA